MLGVEAEQSQSATLALSVGEFLSHKTINLQELRIQPVRVPASPPCCAARYTCNFANI